VKTVSERAAEVIGVIDVMDVTGDDDAA